MRVDPRELAQWKSALARAQTQPVRWWERLYRRLRPGPLRVFVSYKSQARAQATQLASRLAKVRGVHVWQDVDELRAGDKWSLRLAQEAARADVMVCWLDPGYFTSEWTAFEVGILTGTHARIGDHPTARLMPVWSGARLPDDVCPDVFSSSQSLGVDQDLDATLDATAQALAKVARKNRWWRARAQILFSAITLASVSALTLVGVGIGTAARCRADAGDLSPHCSPLWTLELDRHRALRDCGSGDAACVTTLKALPAEWHVEALKLGCGTHREPRDCEGLFARPELHSDAAEDLSVQWAWYWKWRTADPMTTAPRAPDWLTSRSWPAPGTALGEAARRCAIQDCGPSDMAHLASTPGPAAQLVRELCTGGADLPAGGSPQDACTAWFDAAPYDDAARCHFCKNAPDDPACNCAITVQVVALPFAQRDALCSLSKDATGTPWDQYGHLTDRLNLHPSGATRAHVVVNTNTATVEMRDAQGGLILRERRDTGWGASRADPCVETRDRTTELMDTLADSDGLQSALPSCWSARTEDPCSGG